MRLKRALLITVIVLLPLSVFGQEHVAKIMMDYESGQISKHDYIVNNAYAVFAPERLSADYRPQNDIPVKCGTWAIIELRANLDLLSAEEQQFFKVYLARPSLPLNYLSLSGNFKIHYTLFQGSVDRVSAVDIDQNGIPDFVEEVGIAFDHSYRYIVDTLGYDPMPAENFDGPEYDIYIQNVPAYGMTTPEFASDSTPPEDRISYITVDNDYPAGSFYTTGYDALRVTAAHELHHAVQFRYSFNLSQLYFFEITSTWMEDMVYDQINDYIQYLLTYRSSGEISPNGLFRNFDKPFNTSNGWHEYGMSVWNHFITKAYGADVIRTAWEGMEDYSTGTTVPAIAVFDNIFETNPSVPLFNDVLHDFYTWNYFSADRADTVNYYTDGRLFPELIYTEDISELIYTEDNSETADTSLSVSTHYLSTQYIRVYSQQPAAFTVHARAGEEGRDGWQISLALMSGNQFGNTSAKITNLSFKGISGNATITGTGFNTELIIIANCTAKTMSPLIGGRYFLDLDITVSSPEPITSNKLLGIWPSPANFSLEPSAKIPFIIKEDSEVEIKIFSISGRLIRSFPSKQYYSLDINFQPWDGTDVNGNNVPSGVYLCVMKGEGFSDMKKIAVVR